MFCLFFTLDFQKITQKRSEKKVFFWGGGGQKIFSQLQMALVIGDWLLPFVTNSNLPPPSQIKRSFGY